MKRKKCTDTLRYAWMLAFVCVSFFIPSAGGFRLGGNHDGQGQHLWAGQRPHVQLTDSSSVNGEPSVLMRRLLSTNDTTSEDKTIWEKIEDFYSDSNNMAMFCVLPIIVLIYGGCSAIYCVYKCRRYLRRRKHKRLRNEDDNSVTEDERNDLNQEGDTRKGGEDGQPIKTVSGSAWDDASGTFTDVGYNVQQRKKTPLPWDTPQKVNQLQRQDSFAENDDVNYSAGSRDSTSMALEREREKLDRKLDSSDHGVEHFMKEKKAEEMRHNPPPPPRPQPPAVAKANDFSRFANSRPIEIVPISQKEYQRHMESRASSWDPLHNRPFESRASGGGGEGERRSGRDSAWSIRDEIMAKYDALTSLAMAKRTADVLRANAVNPNMDTGHHPDTLRRKPGKKKLIFIAE